MKRIFFYIIILSILQFNCAGSIFSLKTIKEDDFSDKIKKVYIIPALTQVSSNFYNEFISNLQKLLTNKKINYKINDNQYNNALNDNSKLNETNYYLNSEITQFSPDYVLKIIMVKVVYRFEKDPANAHFELTLISASDKTEKWKARLHYNFGGEIVPDTAKGSKFAEIILDILTEEKLI